ncbi:hypothetical protein B0T18DRAFT_373778 [Schizothecium vesticola]|uniref:tRNA wybutosine-synthesizing protein 4 n=1 Tax=Schizothecium vesticola TaxID=314040 RepID=A0AA40EJZ6_9PEZI|nr:hypothetical protein B0T18DRAFT_373778 [Schizothecium vesticola]
MAPNKNIKMDEATLRKILAAVQKAEENAPPPPPPPTAPVKSAQAKAQDDQVMATNNSSIVSKRSVEKLYYPTTAHHFFRHFVPKFQRRAPLINRGYHLRQHVIDVLVREFLSSPDAGDGRQKVVVNLGCGSDVLPWQCLARYPAQSRGAKFIDVDFPELMARKRQVVEATPALRTPLRWVREQGELAAPVVYESDEYVQIGCDLRDLEGLRKGLDMVVDVETSRFLFVAEVSVTYMEREGADSVLGWAGGLGDAEFVLLEQILPGGEQHHFASTMLGHFGKLNTQLKSVSTYPTLGHQLERFSSRGWGSVEAWTLWQAWANDKFFSPAERRKLDEVEPFDEWEEFALFGSHYCLIHAKTKAGEVKVAGQTPAVAEIPLEPLTVRVDAISGQRGQRRFAAAMALPEQGAAVNVMGLGTKSRLQSCDVYSYGQGSKARELAFGEGGPSSRMCHTLTDLGDGRVLLAGGRSGPASPMKDCWLFNKSADAWSKTHDLPAPLYRHSAVSLRRDGLALLAGGRGATSAGSAEFLVYVPQQGWVVCEVVSDERPLAVYGGILGLREDSKSLIGIFAGGLNDGVIAAQVLTWELDISDLKKPSIRFAAINTVSYSQNLLTRFGATCFWHKGAFLVIGGVIRDHLLDKKDDILRCLSSGKSLEIKSRYQCLEPDGSSDPLIPLYVGNSTVPLPDGRVVILGGGATCFSMGTYWNKGIFTLDFERTASEPVDKWAYEKSVEIIPGERSIPIVAKPKLEKAAEADNDSASTRAKSIPRIKLQDSDEFVKVVRGGRPVVIEGLELGSCTSAWSLDRLGEKVGKNRKVVIHESATQAMDFNAKNFRYVTTDFGSFIDGVKKGDKTYLRALSQEKPTEKPALLADDFPELAPDFVLPPQLFLVQENLFSSVLRVSGPVNMWLHYDVMANVYCQIGGSKRLILFPPGDVEHLSFAPGASSSSIDVFSLIDSPQLAQTHPQEAVLSPGDVLFLPPLWLHTATPTTNNSIAVNVFFKDLEGNCYAAGRDVYGNRDLAAYEKGRQDVARIANSFQKLPADAREFYLLRLADELRRKARG